MLAASLARGRCDALHRRSHSRRVRVRRRRAADVRRLARVSGGHWLCGIRHVGARGRGSRKPLRPAVMMLLAIAATLAAGFGYAAWRAHNRLAEELPRAWEGEDIEILGVVDDLPAASAQGTRFAFAVERVRTPRAVVPSSLSLAWFAPLRPAFPDEEVPVVHAGERWVPDGAVEASAWHGQPRRLRSRSVAAAAGIACDRLCASGGPECAPRFVCRARR